MSNLIIIYGGCFNPPTNMHILIANKLIDILQAEKLLFLPVGDLYNKSSLIPAKHRVQMLELVCIGNEKMAIDLTEVNSDRALHSIETLDIIQEKYKDKELVFVMGTDNLRDITSWGNLERLLTKYKVAVIDRGNDDILSVYKDNPQLNAFSNNILQIKDVPNSDISSTLIRSNIQNSKDISQLTSRKVEKYIKENKLYRRHKWIDMDLKGSVQQ